MASSLRSIDSSSIAFSDKDFELLSKSFTDEKFLEYLREFANEISDPRNLDHYESEVKKFNKERGVDVNFIKSSPGIALRTERVDNDTIVYVNISVSEEIRKPSFKFKENEHVSGFNWVIPHAILNPRKEFDIGKQWCQYTENSQLNFRSEKEYAKIRKEGIWIYEVVVNPICLQLANQNATLCHHLIEIVCDNIYAKLKIKLKSVVTLGHGLYIGTPATSQIKSVSDPELFHETENSFDFSYGKAQENKSCEHYSDANKHHRPNHNIQHCFSEMPIVSTTAMQSIPATPKYKLKHVNHVSLQDYSVLQKDEPQSLRPQDLVLEVELPGVMSASIIDVDSFGKEIKLKTTKEPLYNLSLTLPYEVKDDSNSAKFDVTKSILEIRFHVVQAKPSCSFLDSRTLSQSKLIPPESEKSLIENLIEPKMNDGSDSKDADDQSVTRTGETSKAVNDFLNHAILPSCCISQSDDFLFVYIPMENLDIKSARSMKLEVQNSTTFTFQFKGSKINSEMRTASLDFPLLYGGKISVFPNSFKEKGITYHILENKLLIQIEKCFPKLWEGITINSKFKKVEEPNKDEVAEESNSFESVTTDMSSSENNGYRTLRENGFQLNQTANTSVDDQCKEVSLEGCTFPNCEYIQSTEFFFINVKHKKGSFSDIVLTPVNFKNFRFEYKHTEGEGDISRIYGGFVSTAPHTYKSEGLSHCIIEDTLLIKVAKKKPALWRKIRAGLEPQQLKEMKLKSPRNSNKEQELYVQAFSVSEDDENGPMSGEERTLSTDQKENEPLKSSEVAIPSGGRATNGCFVTGSWPRGILKSRSRSLSDSRIDGHFDSQCDLYSSNFNSVFGSSLECEDEALMHEEEDDDEGDGEALVGSPSKKSVRFNDFVCKQVFRSNASIVGQKVKNQKKAQQKKRARERKLSEGSQSSETEATTEPSDFATTTEDDSNTEGERKEQCSNLPSVRRERIGRKRREKSNKKNKKKKPGLNLSTEITEMVFQLDDD